MSNYIAIIHKDENSCFGVSFPDVSGVFTAGDTLDEAIYLARDVLAFAAESWEEDKGSPFPKPRSIDELRTDPEFIADSAGAILAAVPFETVSTLAAAE
jgi:predicted RNase H-like HicB family nuclease